MLPGCTGGELSSHIVGGKGVPEESIDWPNALRVAEWWKDNLPDGRYFLEVQQFPELETTRAINPQLARMAAKLQLPLIATGDCHYPRPEDSYMQQILHNVRGGFRETWNSKINDGDTMSHSALLVLTGSCIAVSLVMGLLVGRHFAQSSRRKRLVKNVLECAYPYCQCSVIRFPTSTKTLPASYMLKCERAGFISGCHLLSGRDRADYRTRLARELKVIEEKGYQDYFLVVGDVVRYCKEQQIPVGPARGSAAASIVCMVAPNHRSQPYALSLSRVRAIHRYQPC